MVVESVDKDPLGPNAAGAIVGVLIFLATTKEASKITLEETKEKEAEVIELAVEIVEIVDKVDMVVAEALVDGEIPVETSE